MAWRDVSAVRNLAIFLCAIAVCVLAPSAVRHFTDGLFEEHGEKTNPFADSRASERVGLCA